MPLAPGARLGPYEILSALGAGGMGEVWKARDTRLNRLVAIKASLSPFSERVEREARAIAAVNHPHVCALYDVGLDYLVMEYVEGQWLHGPVPPAQVLAVAEQILDALAAAHERGIVHRDLKPSNILLTRSGVKVLDFGLAKITHATAPAGAGGVETETVPLTAEGSIMGTLPYMSPEQVEGRDADARSDIFAFGVVLYELIAGTRPFTGQTQANLVASILKEEPRPLLEIQPRTPRGLAEVVRICLEKDPEKRWQSARDVKHALRWMAAEPQPSTVTRSARPWQALAALMTAAALGIGAWTLRPAAPGSASRVEAAVPEKIAHDYISASPDGRKLAISTIAPGGLWIRDLDASEWRSLPGTEGASSLFWSPDSRYVGFIVGNTLQKIDTSGGPPETLATVPTTVLIPGSWNGRGDIVLGSWSGGSGGPLWRASASGGAATAVTQVDSTRGEFVHTLPTFLPDGNHFLYFRSGPADVEGMYVGSLDVDAGNQSRDRILATSVPAGFANGHLFFVRGDTLMAQPFDARRLKLVDVPPVPVVEHIDVTWYFTGMFTVSDNVLVYYTATAPGTFQLTWVDRQGKPLSTIGPPATDGQVVLSPNGKRAIAKDAPYNVQGDLWMLDLAGGRTRFTFGRDVYSPAVWSPDGERVAYSAGRLGDTIYAKPASGLGDAQVLLKVPGLRHYPTSWSRDGRFLLYHTENAANTGYDLWALSLADRQPHLLLGEAYNEWAGVFSPDMQWVAYVSLEIGPLADVFVRPFRASKQTGQPSLGEGKWQVSRNFGNWPQWRTDNEILFNRAPGGTAVFAAPVRATDAAFVSGVPYQLPFPPNRGVSSTPQFDRDGQRFLIQVPVDSPAPRHSFSVLLNWPALVKR